MIPVFADTSYFVALSNPTDVAHEAAVQVASHLQSQVLTTAWVLAELANALAAMRQRRLFIFWHERLKSDPKVIIVPPSEALFQEGAAFYGQYEDKDWSLTDCISFLVMRKSGAQEALTGDHHFEQAGFRALLR